MRDGDQASLFTGGDGRRSSPLADRMRPRTLDEFVGQEHLLAPGSMLRKAIESDEISSMVFWGPPGTGKTTLARIIAGVTKARFVAFSAVTSGIPQIRKIIQSMEQEHHMYGRRSILFVDELHRFNKSQQDAFLPYIEKGTIILIGATTENPSFELNAALLSRCRVYTLNRLSVDELKAVIDEATADEGRGLGNLNVDVEPSAVDFLAHAADGDARIALNVLEIAAQSVSREKAEAQTISVQTVAEALQSKPLVYDKSGEEHYNLLSALHKTIRSSDPDAALYWLARMLEGGEEPLIIARRLIRVASEDVGNADPQALPLAIAAKEAVHFNGLPEADLALAQTIVYLALAPKSDAIYAAYKEAQEDARKHGSLPPPLNIRNAPTHLMKELGYGKGYRHAHNFKDAVVNQQLFPEEMGERTYYRPVDRGFEREMKKRLEWWKKRRKSE
ncbi:MAG: replication-associated recombination protein A [Candidatus Eisenbacteria sp.]|nr:replication-associated recombination protein A [Candidatus Eisenbacteria bacterium]